MRNTRRLAPLFFTIIGLYLNDAARQDKDVVHVEFDLGGLETKNGIGTIVIAVHPSWSPNGAKRFLKLVKLNHFSGCKFFRVIENFMAQVGIPPLPDKSWDKKPIQDDPSVGRSNRRGFVTFATAGPNTRSQQIFFNFKDNSFLDSQGFTPFGEVTSGLELVDSLHVTGEGAPGGPGPSQGKILQEGNKYLESEYPNLSFIKACRIVQDKSVLPNGDEQSHPQDTKNPQILLRGESEIRRGISSNVIWSVGALCLFICGCLAPCNHSVKRKQSVKRYA